MAKQQNMPDDLYRIRHSLAHIMAEAVTERYTDAKPTIGPPIENGFYYDFYVDKPFTSEDLQAFEARMKEIVKSKVDFTCREVSEEEAKKRFAANPFKLELIQGLATGAGDDMGEGEVADETPKGSPAISIYTQDTFTDLCRGPHVANTREINPEAFKLTTSSGAYWRGNEHNPMLQRIYGVAFKTRQELDAYMKQVEEAEKRDHRKLGQELDLFSIQSESGPGLVLYHPKGAVLRTVMEDYWRERHRQGGYEFVFTPHIGRSVLWQTSGHLKWYEEGMYSSIDIDDEQYYLKPMNCPFHMLIFRSKTRSYRDLPMRLAELGTVYRYERSGTLHGLLRVRGFTQDDAHIFCRPDQVMAEINRTLDFCLSILAAFGFDRPHVELSVRDPLNLEKYAGSDADWDMAESTLAAALAAHGFAYQRMEGEAVFYGPKIDIKIVDALGRRWQASTIQFDFNLPERFDLSYIGEDGQQHRPYMVHRALYGSIERFMALLIEHYAGAFPVWLAPVQAIVIPIADRHVEYAHQVRASLGAAGIRAELDEGRERMNAKIRNAQLQKIPYMLVVGDKEIEQGAVSIRLRTGEDRGVVAVTQFIDQALKTIAQKELIG
jgi:threonyl-tRNA synthetase